LLLLTVCGKFSTTITYCGKLLQRSSEEGLCQRCLQVQPGVTTRKKGLRLRAGEVTARVAVVGGRGRGQMGRARGELRCKEGAGE
jgi:hypothetical protein